MSVRGSMATRRPGARSGRQGKRRTVEVVALVVANAVRHVDICVPNHAAYRHRGQVCARNAMRGYFQGRTRSGFASSQLELNS